MLAVGIENVNCMLQFSDAIFLFYLVFTRQGYIGKIIKDGKYLD
jgi:hypothetical protein